MTDGITGGEPPTTGEHRERNDGRRLIAATCLTHGGAINFTNVVVSKIDGRIELDPHADRSCVLRFDEDGATALYTTLGRWLG